MSPSNRPDIAQYKSPSESASPTGEQEAYTQQIEAQLQQISNEEGLEMGRDVKFCLEHPDDPGLKDSMPEAWNKAQDLKEQVANDIKEQFKNDNFNPKLNQKVVQENLSEAYYESVDLAADTYNQENHPGLSPKEMNQLRAAIANPKLAKSLPPALQKALQDITGNAAQIFKERTGATPEYTDQAREQFGEKWQENLTQSEFRDFQAQIDNYTLQHPEANPEEMNSLKYMFNHPEAQKSASPKMQELFNQMMQNVQQKYQDQGVPPELTVPTPNAQTDNDVMLLGYFESEFEQKLRNAVPPLTDNQKLLLKQALGETTPNLPPELQKLFEEIKTTTLSDIQDKYGLPKDWQPKFRNLADPSIAAQKKQFAQSEASLKNAEEIYEQLQQLAAKMPDSDPKRISLSNYLKIIGDALNTLKETLYEMEAQDASKAKTLTNMNMDMQLNSIMYQKHQADEIANKQDKMASMGFFGDMMKVVMYAMIVVACSIMFGPVLGGILAALVIKDKEDNGENWFMQKVMDKMMEVTGDLLPPGLREYVQWQLMGLIVGMTFVVAGPMESFNMFMKSGQKVIANFLIEAFGMDPMVANIIAMVILLIAVIIIMIIITIASAGAAAPEAAGATAGATAAAGAETGAATAEAAATTASTAANALRAAQVAITVVSCVFTATSGAISMAQEILMGQIEQLKAELDAYQVMIKAFIKAIKKIIDDLINGMTDIAGWVNNINSLQGKKFQDASQIISSLCAA